MLESDARSASFLYLQKNEAAGLRGFTRILQTKRYRLRDSERIYAATRVNLRESVANFFRFLIEDPNG